MGHRLGDSHGRQASADPQAPQIALMNRLAAASSLFAERNERGAETSSLDRAERYDTAHPALGPATTVRGRTLLG